MISLKPKWRSFIVVAILLIAVALVFTACGTKKTTSNTTSGGTPYGPSHHAGAASDRPITADEKKLCIALGRRLAGIALKLAA